MATYKLELPLSLNYKTMVGTESQRKLLYNVRPMSEPCLIMKSNSQYQKTSQNSGNKNKQSMVKTQTGRQLDRGMLEYLITHLQNRMHTTNSIVFNLWYVQDLTQETPAHN